MLGEREIFSKVKIHFKPTSLNNGIIEFLFNAKMN